jgi:hypothetical protein
MHMEGSSHARRSSASTAATLLWCAARDGHTAEVQRLADEAKYTGLVGVDAVGRDPDDDSDPQDDIYPNSTPLAIACGRQQHECARILLRAGADPCSAHTGGDAVSIMHAAIAGHRHEVIRLLVGFGVDASIPIADSSRSLDDLLNSESASDHATALVLLDVGVEVDRQRYLRAVRYHRRAARGPPRPRAMHFSRVPLEL